MTDQPSPAPASPPAITFSDDEKRMLQLLAVVFRSAQASPPSDSKPSIWKEVLSSTVVASLITVVIGGLAGNWLVAQYQDRSKDHERALDDHKETRKRQEEVGVAAIQLLGDAHSTATEIMSLTRPNLQRFNVAKGDQPTIDKKRANLADGVNTFLRRWDKEEYSTGTLLAYYCNSEVRTAWSGAAAASDKLLGAADKNYAVYMSNPKAPHNLSIATEEQAFALAEQAFGTALERTRTPTN